MRQYAYGKQLNSEISLLSYFYRMLSGPVIDDQNRYSRSGRAYDRKILGLRFKDHNVYKRVYPPYAYLLNSI